LLAKRFGSIDRLSETSVDELLEVREIGPQTARCITDFFADSHNRAVLDRLRKAGVEFPESGKKEGGLLSGKLFLFTGTLESFTRDEAKEAVEAAGGEVAGSVSKKVDFVVSGSTPGSKHERAKKLGLNIIDEKAFKELLGRG